MDSRLRHATQGHKGRWTEKSREGSGEAFRLRCAGPPRPAAVLRPADSARLQPSTSASRIFHHSLMEKRKRLWTLANSGSGLSPKRVTLYSLQARLISFRCKIASFILSKRKSKLADISVVEIILKFGRVAGLLLLPRQNDKQLPIFGLGTSGVRLASGYSVDNGNYSRDVIVQHESTTQLQLPHSTEYKLS
ncbi:hypothetical protein CISG_10246 [Coccidioides immitis RMSCC 3703]|uniref:Uncharacterized protein n=1 Tax=Coccidioides immitis RMSCC 3703 TaxID=454286 RepID=A0A0J8QS05_COCIT|nr:hypothetical protein CISG_10246 [Coccidioides immitis RMSCC 3703]